MDDLAELRDSEDAALSAAIDLAEDQAQRARERGWPTIAAAFERLRGELVDLVLSGADR